MKVEDAAALKCTWYKQHTEDTAALIRYILMTMSTLIQMCHAAAISAAGVLALSRLRPDTRRAERGQPSDDGEKLNVQTGHPGPGLRSSSLPSCSVLLLSCEWHGIDGLRCAPHNSGSSHRMELLESSCIVTARKLCNVLQTCGW